MEPIQVPTSYPNHIDNKYEYIVPKNYFFTKVAIFFNKSYASFNLAINKDELSEANNWFVN